MGEAADDAYDNAMRRQDEWDSFMDFVRLGCGYRMLGRIPCAMILTPTNDEVKEPEGFKLLTCMHCGKQFDPEY